ncbi:MAG: leucine-rich repeat domain-containing protein, partial [Oscillospiraceae bacterium]|nr:leucine-rich repeat domain-containing protein [Oscillospiraceae bacterium]
MMKRKRAAVSVLTAVVMVSSMGVSASGVYMKPVSTENADGAIYTYNSETDQYELLEDTSDGEATQISSYLADLESVYVEQLSDEEILEKLKDAGIYDSTDSKYEMDCIDKYRAYYELSWTDEVLEPEERDDGRYIVTIGDSYVIELEEGDEEKNCIVIRADYYWGHGLIPNTVLGDVVVAVCSSAPTYYGFKLDSENKYMKCVDNVLFSKDGKRLMSYPCLDESETYTVPDGTEVIGEYAFYNVGIWVGYKNYDHYYLTSLSEGVVIPNSVQCVEEKAFAKCKALSKVVFMEGDNHLTIDERAFYSCDSLEEVILPNFDVEMDRSVFENSESLSRLTTYAQPTLTSEGTTIRW